MGRKKVRGGKRGDIGSMSLQLGNLRRKKRKREKLERGDENRDATGMEFELKS